MKSNTYSYVLILAALVMSIGTFAQAQLPTDVTITADIPFPFIVGNTTLGPGKYVIRSGEDPDNDFIVIRGESGHPAVMVLVVGNELHTVPTQTELEFDRYGDQEFLSKILVGGIDNDVQLEGSRAEFKLMKRGLRPRVHRHPAVLQRGTAKKK